MNLLTKIRDKAATKKKIAAIHNEFFTASERLLKEAQEIINMSVPSKGQRLLNLGFYAHPDVEREINRRDKERDNAAAMKYVKYYAQNYPLYKFITERQVKEICNKYGLVQGEASRFKGFIPERNLLAIEQFRLKDEDKRFRDSSSIFGATITLTFRNGRISPGPINENVDTHSKNGEIETPLLQICGPTKDFDTSGMILRDGYKLQHVPDPVVLQPVKGGYLIVTAWGDEASDENVVNAVHN